jgi:zinc and cadmium transporter
MTIAYLYAFGSVLIVSLISLIGVLSLSILKEETLKKYISFFISLAVGALLGDSFIHLIPETLETSSNTLFASVLIIIGILVFFILEKFLHWHHHGEDKEKHVHPVGKLILLSDSVHNAIDGLIIGVSFMVSIPIGIATTIAVILHEIPQEIGDFAVLIHSGYKKSRAIWLNFLSALCAVLGVILAFILGENGEVFASWILPLAAGGFIYIALADLIPELHKTERLKYAFFQVVVVILGVVSMALLTLLE